MHSSADKILSVHDVAAAAAFLLEISPREYAAVPSFLALTVPVNPTKLDTSYRTTNDPIVCEGCRQRKDQRQR